MNKNVPQVTSSLVVIVIGIYMMISSAQFIQTLGMIFLLGGESLFGVDIVKYFYNKSVQQNGIKVQQN